ncbi:MAG: hypothetical protein IJ650_02435 [Paludibacteraceae bacterium]|nr:hypothetical protein [Paludibacteraceae bacterium]
MRKYLFNIFCLVLPLYLFADPNCPVVQPAIINPGTSIECWGTDYEECIVQEWDITIPEDYNYVEFEYIIDLNPNGAIDALYIYTEDENHIEREVLNYNYQPMTGRIQVYTSNQVIRVVLVSQYGNSGEMYRGFKLSYRYADTGIADQVIYSNLGIGIQPQERLHVNGPVRGDGESGSLRIRTTSGTTEIGAANSGYSHFYTDRPAFFFSKPLYINGGVIGSYGQSDLQLRTADTPRLTIDTAGHVGIGTDEPEEALHINGNIRGNGALGALTIRTEAGTTTIGAQGWSYSHFQTSMPRFYFYKPIMVANGEFSSGAGQNLYLQTFNTAINGSSPTTRVTILNSNGNVGIGTNNPSYKLDVNGTIHAKEVLVDMNEGADYVFDKSYNLMPLDELKRFINENKHLPDIPSADDMVREGVNINELQIILLRKIEELILYVLHQEEVINQQQQQIEALLSK